MYLLEKMAVVEFEFGEKKNIFSSIFEKLFLCQKQNRPLKPLSLSYCNGGCSWSFEDASISYRKPKYFNSFPYDLWYERNYLDFINVLTGKAEVETEDKPIIQCLFDYVLCGEHHLKCLRSSLSSDSELSESNIISIIALHYFKPLVPCCSYIIDKGRNEQSSECKFCKEEIKYGDASFGNIKVWHGDADILLNGSVIKVSSLKNIENMTLGDVDHVDEGETIFCQGDRQNLHHCEECQDDDGLHCSDPFKDIKQMKDTKLRAAKTHVLAQAITNAFCESRKNKSLFNQFIPSFLVTESHIRIILYNCELDVLLMSEELPIWNEDDDNLDILTIVRVWLALNYSCKMANNSEEYRYILEHTVKSDFKQLVGTAYSVYLNDMDRPLKEGKRSPQYLDVEFDLETHRFRENHLNKLRALFLPMQRLKSDEHC